MPRRLRVTVTGRVQGVFYRNAAAREAERLGLSGWVRNSGDGGVELEVEGRSAAVDEFVEWARLGPPRARVDRLRSLPLDPIGQVGFDVRA